MTFRVDLLASTEDLLEFVKRTWSHQRVDVGVVIETVRVSGVGRLGSLFGTALQGIRLDLAVPSESLTSLVAASGVIPRPLPSAQDTWAKAVPHFPPFLPQI